MCVYIIFFSSELFFLRNKQKSAYTDKMTKRREEEEERKKMKTEIRCSIRAHYDHNITLSVWGLSTKDREI